MSRLLYFDCFSGVAGDMTLGALIDLGLDVDRMVAALRALPLSPWRLDVRRVSKSTLTGVKVDVWVGDVIADQQPPDHAHAHHGHHYRELRDMIAHSDLPPPVIARALSAFAALAKAEARVHGTTVDDVHFHEVGAVDSVIDLVGCAWGLWALGVDVVEAAPLPISRGFVQTAHGRLPLPAPATAHLIEGLPIVPCPIQRELVTPTGAAMIKAWARRIGDVPAMTLSQVGWGAGTIDLPDRPNLLRLMLGEAPEADAAAECTLLTTNIDDMNPELAGHLLDAVFSAGALDAWFTPIQMKKNRPGVVVSALTSSQTRHAVEAVILRESTAIGLRRQAVSRAVLPRRIETVTTPLGPVDVKIAGRPGEPANVAPEFESCRAVATAADVPLKVVYQHAIAAWLARGEQ